MVMVGLLQDSLLEEVLESVKDLVAYADVESVKDLVAYADVDFSSTGLKIRAISSVPHVMVDIHTGVKVFDRYQCDHGFSVCIKFNDLSGILKRSVDHVITDIITDNSGDGNGSVTFKFGYSEPKLETKLEMEPFLPKKDLLEVTPDANVMMPSAEFAKICDIFERFGGAVTISFSEGFVEFSSKCEFGTAIYILEHSRSDKQSEEETITVVMNKPVSESSMYKVSYLKTFTKVTNSSEIVKISFYSGFGLVVESDIDRLGRVIFYQIAEELETDEEESEEEYPVPFFEEYEVDSDE